MAPDERALMAGDGSDAVGITQREMLLEMRADLKTLREAVDGIAKDQAMSVERRANMQRTAETLHARLDAHERRAQRPAGEHHGAVCAVPPAAQVVELAVVAGGGGTPFVRPASEIA